MPCRRSIVGRIYKAKRWAKRFGRGRAIRKVKGGYKIVARLRRKRKTRTY